MTARTAFAAVLLAAVAGCRGDVAPSPPAPREVDARRTSSKELRETTAANGVLAGAEAGHRLLAAVPTVQPPDGANVIVITPKSPVPPAVPPQPAAASQPAETAMVSVRAPARGPDPRQPAVRIAGIRSDKPQPTEARAIDSALQVAKIELHKKLAELDPPVIASPGLVAIRTEYLKRTAKVEPTEEMKKDWKANGLDPNRVWAEVDIELTDAQVQKLRAGGRVSDGLRGAGLLFAVALAAHGFLRLDAWTKGYLTGWLAAAAVGLVAAAGLMAVL